MTTAPSTGAQPGWWNCASGKRSFRDEQDARRVFNKLRKLARLGRVDKPPQGIYFCERCGGGDVGVDELAELRERVTAIEEQLQPSP